MKLAGIILSLGLLLALAGCGGSGEQVVKVALVCPLTGDIAAHGQGMKRGFEMAIEDANAAHKLGATKIEAALFDDRGDPKEAVTIANQIISDRAIIGVIGHLNSGCSIPASRIYEKRNVPMISPASTNPKLTMQGYKNVFRVCGTDDVQGAWAANYVFDTLKFTQVAAIHDKTPYGQGLAEEFQKQFVARGGIVTSFNGIDQGEKDFKALITRIKTENPQLLYFGGLYAEGGLITKQMKELGLAIPLMGGDGMFSNEFARIAGSASEGDFATMVGLPPGKLPQAADFIARYAAKYPGQDMQPYDPYTYDGATLLIDAYAKANQNRDSLIAAIAGITYDGILGRTTFDERGDTRNKQISIYHIKDGRFAYYEHQ